MGADRHPKSAPDAATLRPGFADPVHDAQAVFRTLMTAFAGPGQIHTLDVALDGPAGLSAAAGAMLLTLADFETPVWLPAGAREGAVAAWLKFHTGTRIVSGAAEARLAVVGGAANGPPLAAFDPGTDLYPDRSATLIVEVAALEGGAPVTLTGPGIENRIAFAPVGLRPGFWGQARENSARYPLGVDLVFTTGHRLAGLPRSTRIGSEAS